MVDKRQFPKAQNPKSKNGKALGQDPFEDIIGPDGTEADLATEQPGPPAFLPPAKSSEKKAPFNKPPASVEEVEAEAQTSPETVAESENGQKVEVFSPADEGDPATEPMEETGEASTLLDELVATIDKEIEQTLGSNLMAYFSAETPTEHRGEQHVIFTLADTNYAVSIANVSEVGSLTTCTLVPNVPNWLVGVTNLRGDILSVVDLGAFLELESPEDMGTVWAGKEREMMVVHLSQNRSLLTIGLLIDAVQDIRYLNPNQLNTPTIDAMDSIKPYLRGIYDDDGAFLIALDFDKLLLSPQMQQFEPV